MSADSSSSICVIGFDLDETLWSLEGVIERANQQTWAFLMAKAPAISVSGLSQHQSPNKAAIEARFEHHISNKRLHLMHDLLTQSGLNDAQAWSIARNAMDVFMRHRHELTLYDGVLEGLRELTQRFALASISNGNAQVSEVPELKGLFDFSINAEDLNSSKPAPDLFHATCDYLKCTPSSMVYVGDNLVCDVFAPHKLGIRAIWMNWHGRASTDQTVPHEAHDFSELLALIDTLD
ncbi:MAG: HAD family hydrolase [Pseudomonadota bacterium]